MFHPSSFWNAVLLPLLLACALPASFMTLTAPRRSYSIVSVAAAKEDGCLNYGCPLFPLDVIKSQTTRKGLEFLRKQQQKQEEEDTGDHDKVNDSIEYTKVMESLKKAGNEDKVILTLMGYKGGALSSQINQDAGTIISPFLVGNDSEENNPCDSQLLGVFDGHGTGGEITSNHAATTIPQRLADKLQEQMKMEQVVSPTALKASVVTKAIQEAFVDADQGDPTKGEGGATATMILQLGHRLFIANAGDSRSFIGVFVEGKVHVVYASREDKPDLPDERRRITEAGGYVHIPDAWDDDVPRAYYVDPQGRARFGLAMSRTIGDWQVQGVIAEPIVDVLNIATLVHQALTNHTEACQSEVSYNVRHSATTRVKEEHDCPELDPRDIHIVAVSASDGMMDYLTPQEIASEMGVSFFAKNGKHPFVVAEYLILKAADGWDTENFGRYRDDIAMSAVKVIVNDRILEEGRRDIGEDHDEL